MLWPWVTFGELSPGVLINFRTPYDDDDHNGLLSFWVVPPVKVIMGGIEGKWGQGGPLQVPAAVLTLLLIE